jgi:hypothetical protein
MNARIQAMKQLTQHSTNVLHIYCRLRDMGLSKKWAGRVAKVYERTFGLLPYL